MYPTSEFVFKMEARKSEHELAIKLYSESLEISRGIGDQQGIVNTLNNMAIALINKRNMKNLFSMIYILHNITKT